MDKDEPVRIFADASEEELSWAKGAIKTRYRRYGYVIIHDGVLKELLDKLGEEGMHRVSKAAGWLAGGIFQRFLRDKAKLKIMSLPDGRQRRQVVLYKGQADSWEAGEELINLLGSAGHWGPRFLPSRDQRGGHCEPGVWSGAEPYQLLCPSQLRQAYVARVQDPPP